jgi:hypothetical protein
MVEWIRGSHCDIRRPARIAERIPLFPGAFDLEQAIGAQGH